MVLSMERDDLYITGGGQMSKKINTHESKELNALLGKKIQITFFDNDVKTGILRRAEYKQGRYEIDNLSFRKTHVKKIEVARCQR